MKCIKVIAIIFVFLIQADYSLSDIIHVPADQPTIQAGIDAASDGDTVLVSDGIYTGDGNRDIDLFRKSIVVISESGAANTIIDCEGSAVEPHRGFYFHSGEDSTTIIDGFTITGGYGPFDTNEKSVGSGIKCDSASSPTLKNIIFYQNELRTHGGGMYCENSSPVLLNCAFDGNRSFTYNPGLAYGSGLYCINSTPTLTSCTFTGNATNVLLGDGGGMYCMSSNPILNSCIFVGNSAGSPGGKGGGLYSLQSTLTLNDCFFGGNSAEYGGGMNSWADTVVLTNCIFSKNYAWYDTNDGGWGGGLNCWSSDIILTNCTFSGNSANQYMGGYGGAININQSSAVLENCIIAFTRPQSEAISCLDSSPTLICCDIYGNAEGDWVGCIADQEGLNGNMSADPLFCDTANSDYSLSRMSPCIPSNNVCGSLIGALDMGCDYLCGDVDLNGNVNLNDVVYLINSLYAGEPPLYYPQLADVNSSGIINILDITYLIAYLYQGGSEPDCP